MPDQPARPAHEDGLARLTAMMDFLYGPHDTGADGEISDGAPTDPTGRYGVKPLRGGTPEAPIVRHVGFGACCDPARPWECRCPPVRTEGHAESVQGVRARGLTSPRPTMPRGELRSVAVQHPAVGARLNVAGGDATSLDGPPLAEDLKLAPLPRLEPLPEDVTRRAPTSARPDGPVSEVALHDTCRKERDKLSIKVIRAEHSLKKATEEIARLRTELAALREPAKPKRGQKKR